MGKEEFIIYSLNRLDIPLVTRSGKDVVATVSLGYREAGWSSQGFSKFVKRNFPNKDKGVPIFTYLLNTFNKSFCTCCKLVLDKSNFSKNKTSGTKVNGYCKPCNSSYRREKVDTRYYNSKRRAEIQQAIPPWADLDKIKETYKKCPKGYHVDHIYPLNNPIMCGLHVENNLQYLTAKDNLTKSNKVP